MQAGVVEAADLSAREFSVLFSEGKMTTIQHKH